MALTFDGKKAIFSSDLTRDLLKNVDKWLTNSDDVNSDVNLDGGHIWATKGAKPINAPSAISTYAIYIKLDIANWIPVQIAFDADNKGFWIEKAIGGKWTAWEQIGGGN